MQDIGFAKEMIDKLEEGGLKGLTFTGGGEPTFFKGLGKIVNYTTKNKKIDAVVYSNGNCISKNVLEEILDAEPKLIRVSMNCGTKEIYNKFHNPINPKDAFQRCLSSIETFAKGAVENPKINFGVSYVINEINKNDIWNIGQRIKEIVERTKGGISFTVFRPAFDYYGGEQLNHPVLDYIYNEVEEKVRPVLEPLGVSVNNVKIRYDALKENTRNYTECRASGLYSELSPSGNMNLCCDRNCHRDYSFGNLKNNSLHNIFESKERKVMLDKLKETKCSECPPACKPHLTNNQFEEIERLRKIGEIDKVKLWINELRKIPPPVMVNF
jgi:MoaA/NifB/PqqE/SkfB family radical SAM enzyme